MGRSWYSVGTQEGRRRLWVRNGTHPAAANSGAAKIVSIGVRPRRRMGLIPPKGRPPARRRYAARHDR